MRLARGEPIKENRKVVARALVDILDRLPGIQIHGRVQRTGEQLNHDNRRNISELRGLDALLNIGFQRAVHGCKSRQ